jgi:hypothetical protein
MPGRDQLIQPVQEVVARHQPDFHLSCQAQAPGDLEHGLRARPRVDPTCVRGDADAFLYDVGENPFHERNKIPCIACFWISRLLLLHDGHRHFGEVIHHQVIDRPALDLPNRCLEPVAPEPLPCRNPDGGLLHRMIGGSGSGRPASRVHV